MVYLDQVAPSASLSPNLQISSDHGATWQPAQQCDTLVKGVLIKGTYSVSDEHFRKLYLYVEPGGYRPDSPGVVQTGPAHNTAVTPSSRSSVVTPTDGSTGPLSASA